MTTDEILPRLEAMNRGPFRQVLARILACAPTDEAIAEQAAKHPDRWGQLTAIIARLSGYNEKLEVEGTLNQNITQMSDAALLARLAALEVSIAHRQSNSTTGDSPVNQ